MAPLKGGAGDDALAVEVVEGGGFLWLGDALRPNEFGQREHGATGDDHGGCVAGGGVDGFGEHRDGFFDRAGAGWVEGLVFAGDFGEDLAQGIHAAAQERYAIFGPAGADLHQQQVAEVFGLVEGGHAQPCL